MGQDVPVFMAVLHTRNLPVRRTFEFPNRWTQGRLIEPFPPAIAPNIEWMTDFRTTKYGNCKKK